MSREKIFALVDCNNFYVSCERLFNPIIKNRPAVVLSNNDSCVISRSNEAKNLGIKMGDPLFKIENKINLYNIAVFSSNFSLYGDISSRVMEIIRKFSPDIEIYSIDEAFINLTDINMNLDNYGISIVKTVEQWTGIPVSVGMATTKTLAKIATSIAKKHKKFRGFFNMTRHSDIKRILEITPIDDVWGIGHKYAKKTKYFRIENAYQFSKLPDTFIKKYFSVNGLKTAMELRGVSVIPMELFSTRKSIVVSRSFKEPLMELDELKAAFVYFSTLAGEKLRRERVETKFIKIFIKTNRFDKGNYLYNEDFMLLPNYTNTTKDIINTSLLLLNRIYHNNIKYKKAGILFTNLVSSNNKQWDIFCNSAEYKKKNQLSKSMDTINKRYGSYTVKYANINLSSKFLPSQKRKSKEYTTNWKELATVK